VLSLNQKSVGAIVRVDQKDVSHFIRCKCRALTPQTVAAKLTKHVDLLEKFVVRFNLEQFYRCVSVFKRWNCSEMGVSEMGVSEMGVSEMGVAEMELELKIRMGIERDFYS
jgi:hypothetical protein